MSDQPSYRDMLWRCLEREFTVAFRCFRICVSMPSGDGMEVVKRLGKESLEHGEAVASLLRGMGEQPRTQIDVLPVDFDPTAALADQEVLERECLELYRRMLPLLPAEHWGDIQRIISQEEEHLEIMMALLDKARG